MSLIRRTAAVAALVALPLAIAACDRGAAPESNVDALDAELAGNAADPAVAEAIGDQIMVDPALVGQANGDAVRPPGRPYSGGVPASDVAAGSDMRDEKLMRAPDPAGESCKQCDDARQAVTLGELARGQRGGAGCAANLNYSAAWGQRLPADLPLHPDARVTEAAGSTQGECRMRVVSFTVARPMQHMLDWYYTRARRAGYSAEHQASGAEHVLGGTRGRDDGAYVVFLKPARGGTSVDLVVNNGA